LIPIANEVLRGVIPRKCLCYLTRNPFRRQMTCNVDPDEVSAVQTHDDEGIEQTAFSASSRLFDLNGAVKTASTKHSNTIMVR